MVYGEGDPSYDVVKPWHGQFKCGRISAEMLAILGHPMSTIDDATIQQIETAIFEDRRVTERQLVHEINISLGDVEQ